MRPLIAIAQDCLHRLTGNLSEGDNLSIQEVIDRCHVVLGTSPDQRIPNIFDELHLLATSLNVPTAVDSDSHDSRMSFVNTGGDQDNDLISSQYHIGGRKRPKVLAICAKCRKECSSGAALASHMKTHNRQVFEDFDAKIEDMGKTPEEIVESVLRNNIIDAVVRKASRQVKSRGEDGRKLNHKGGVKHRKTYTLAYKAKCIGLYEAALESLTPCPQVSVAQSEEIDLSMLGRWILSKDKIYESLQAQGNKKVMTRDKIDKKNMGKKKRKRKNSVDLSVSIPMPVVVQQQQMPMMNHMQMQHQQVQQMQHQQQHHLQQQHHQQQHVHQHILQPQQMQQHVQQHMQHQGQMQMQHQQLPQQLPQQQQQQPHLLHQQQQDHMHSAHQVPNMQGTMQAPQVMDNSMPQQMNNIHMMRWPEMPV
jgi:hypothetical protein